MLEKICDAPFRGRHGIFSIPKAFEGKRFISNLKFSISNVSLCDIPRPTKKTVSAAGQIFPEEWIALGKPPGRLRARPTPSLSPAAPLLLLRNRRGVFRGGRKRFPLPLREGEGRKRSRFRYGRERVESGSRFRYGRVGEGRWPRGFCDPFPSQVRTQATRSTTRSGALGRLGAKRYAPLRNSRAVSEFASSL